MKKNANATTPRRDRGARGKGKTDWARVDAKSDEDIARDVAGDPDAVLFTDEMFAAAQWVEPEKRTPVTIRLEPDVLAFYKSSGRGYQTRIQQVLRAFMEQSMKGKSRR
jgi:uncharacterized protein (DUF4415 family)